ncbi:DUF2071 domain-containing protein [Cerasicoccus fimbriatus]|uniref:DUF2071 domain-containing protein n=1 Tax=Cerasicoccus fimbriatus TaxID=3014554 RepID=UPI0022B3B328|nr:DUF2071 domain-containing protein [Cerasicoccus sp. TK19100]
MLLKLTKPPRRNPPPQERAAETINAEGGPLLRAAWRDALMVHFIIEPKELQPHTPFLLDLFEGKAVVTLVFFRMTDLRFETWPGGPHWMLKPGEHAFLNVRTYVVVDGEPGIHFLREYVPKLLARIVGPLTYGLPYHFTRMHYEHAPRNRRFVGELAGGRVAVDAEYAFAPEPGDAFNEFVLERYNAFNRRLRQTLRFRVAHPPWQMKRASIREWNDELLRDQLPFWEKAQFAHAHFTEGFNDVAMGAPAPVAA